MKLIFNHPNVKTYYSPIGKTLNSYAVACVLLNLAAEGNEKALSGALRAATRSNPTVCTKQLFKEAVKGSKQAADALIELVAKGFDDKMDYARSQGKTTISF